MTICRVMGHVHGAPVPLTVIESEERTGRAWIADAA